MKTQRFPHDSTVLPGKLPLALLVAQACCLPAIAAPAHLAPSQTLTPVVIYATPGSSNAGGSSVIDRQTLERRPTNDLRSLFDYTPGVNFVGGSYNPLNEVEIRGMGSQSSDVMGNGANRVTMDLDGLEMSPGLSYGYYTRTGRQYFDPADLKEVEIEKGPGANGLSGSVRLRSKDPQDYLRDGANFGGEVRGGFNGENRDFSTGASVAGRFDDANSASISYSRHWFHERKNRSGRDIDGAERTYNDPLSGHSNAVNGKWIYQPHEAHKFTFVLQHYDVESNSRQRQRIGSVSRGAGAILDSHNTRSNHRDAVSVRHDINLATPIFDQANWQLSAQRSSSKGRNTNLMASGNFYDNDDYKVSDYTLNTDFAKTFDGNIRQDIDYGFKLRYGTSDFGSENITPEHRTKGSYFAAEKSKRFQGEVRVADRLSFGSSGFSVTPSLNLTHTRVSHDGKLRNYSKTAPGGGLRFEYQPNDNHLISADYHRATRMPGFIELGSPKFSRPDYQLKPETADGFELAWASQGALGRQRTALYYNHYNNLISVDCSMGGNEPCLFYNIDGHSKIYGAEFSGRLNLNTFGLADGLALEGAAAYGKGSNSKGQPVSRIDPFNGYVGLRYDAPEERWGVASRVKFATAKKGSALPPRAKPLGGYATVEFTGHYKPLDNLTINGGVYNLFNKDYGLWSRARSHPDGYAPPFSEPGRYFAVNFRYQF